MSNGMDMNGPQGQMSQQQIMAQLRRTFESFPHDLPIYHFVDRGKDDVFAQTNRQVIRAFRELSDKIAMREYSLDHELAQKYNVTHSPTLLIAPELVNIRWIGAPLGEEGRTFLELLMLVGMGKSQLKDDAARVLRQIDEPRNVKVFVSPTCPYCPQQALNGVQAAVERPEMVHLEIVDIQCNPELAEKYSAHSVPQTWANEILIAMGAQTPELFCLSLQKLEQQTVFIPDIQAEEVENDVLIVGGGPAGLTAGIYATRSGLATAIVERDALGGQVATTPIVENYTGFSQVGGKSLVDVMVSHALQYCTIFRGEEVLDVTPPPELGGRFEVQTSRRKFRPKAILLATGATHRHLGAPGEKRLSGKGVSYCSTCDGPLFVGKRVIMVGGGNSAVTEALHLHHMGVGVTIVHRRDKLRAQDYLIQNLQDAGISVLWNTEVTEIRGEKRVEAVDLLNNQTDEKTTLPVNGVFLSIGYVPATKLADIMGVEINEEGYIRHDRHRTNVPGVYSAGDVEGGYKQIVTASGQGAEAAMAVFEDLINPYWQTQKAS